MNCTVKRVISGCFVNVSPKIKKIAHVLLITDTRNQWSLQIDYEKRSNL